jgi:hypothetical protein
MQNSYLLAGIKAGRLLAMISRNKGFSLKYIFRVLFLLNAGMWSAIFSRVQNKKFQSKLRSDINFEPPIFIIGNWRTGTTFLHQLFSLDRQFCTPTVFQVANPDHFLVSKKYYIPVMSKFLDDKRPMDNVKMGMDEPQEDEYALLKIIDNTPLEKLIFQQSNRFFLDEYDDFIPEDSQSFVYGLNSFIKKLTIGSNKRVLFKNPFHSLRLGLLKKHYPDAKFIHIYRDPYEVIPSSIHMWNIVGTQNILKGKWIEPQVKSVAILYKRIIVSIRDHFMQMEVNQCCEIKYEQLVAKPVESIKNIYTQLELNYTQEFEQDLMQFCEKLKSYKKNSYVISNADKAQIKKILEHTTPEYFQTDEKKNELL